MTDIDHAAILRQHADTRRRGHSVNPEVLRAAADEIERLRKVLDAAKRVMCRDEATIRLQRHRVHRDSEDVAGLAKEIAVERGWDCFKEDTND